MSDEKLSELYKNTNLLEDFVAGTIISAIAQSPSNLSNINSIRQANIPTMQENIQQTQQPSQVMNENINEDVISQQLEDKFQQGGEVGQRKFIQTAKQSGNLNKATIKELQNVNSDYIIQSDKKIINRS